MGIIVGFLAFAGAAAIALLAWPLGLLWGGYRRAAWSLALLAIIGGVITWFVTAPTPDRPDAYIAPMGSVGAGLFVYGFSGYASGIARGWRWLRGRRR